MIELVNLTKKFNSSTIVGSVNIRIKPGEIVGILGPNGAGKTTTLRMIAGVLPPTSGTVLIDKQDMWGGSEGLKMRIGFLPENNPLYQDMTVEEFLEFWARIKTIPETKKRDAIHSVVRNTNISSVYYRPISELSKGYRQRVGLSQAILTRPDILILDEPTEGLDPNQRREIQELIKDLGKKRTVIVSSHVLSEISRIATRIIIIHKGKVVADGTPEELVHTIGGKLTIEVEAKGRNVAGVLKKLDGVENVVEKSSGLYLVTTAKNKDLRADIFNLAVSNKWILTTLSRKEAALEDVFSEVTKA